MRSYEMKNRDFSYKEYINLQFIIFSWGMLVESLLMFLICFFNKEINMYITSLFILIIICFLPTISKTFINFVYRYIKNNNALNYFKKFNLFNSLKINVEKTIRITVNTINKKNFIVYSSYTICLFFFEFLTFYILLSYIFMITNLKIVILFFILNFLIKKIPLINGILGLREVILGTIMQQFGLIFFESVLFSITFRAVNLVSVLLSNLLFYSLKSEKK